jgi:hypothetical protein
MRLALCLLVSAASLCTRAQSNIDPAHSLSASDFIGQINWRPGDYGAAINQYYSSGFLYSPNVGWIELGAGVPVNKLHYQNNSAADFGVNVDSTGALSGFAYGANIGWINFEQTGNPKVDWLTGKLSGKIYSANAGWIYLDGSDFYVRISSIAPGADSDADGLPDAWEIAVAGNLETLSGSRDADHDDESDLAEYIAGTSPLDPNDVLALQITNVAAAGQVIEWESKPNVVYRLEQRASFDSGNSWQDAGYPPQNGNGGVLTLTLNAETEQTGFYRIHAYPPLTQIN